MGWCQPSEGRTVPAEGTANAKVLRLKRTSHVQVREQQLFGWSGVNKGLGLEGQVRLGHNEIAGMARNLYFSQNAPGSHW